MKFFQSRSKAKIKWGVWLFLLLFCLFFTGNSYFRNNTVERLERHIFDVYSGWVSDIYITPQIAIILAGEESINTLGRWPWSRKKHAQLLKKLTTAHTVIVDILFPEPSNTEDDEALIRAAAEIDNLVLAAHLVSTPETKDPALKKAIPELDKLASGRGYTNIATDVDGMVRYIVPYQDIGNNVVLSQALAAAAIILGEDWNGGFVPKQELLSFLDRNRLMPDVENHLWLALPDNFFQKYEYSQVLNGDIASNEFAGKVVIVGVAASGVEDFFTIPSKGAGKEVSGAELNAHIIKALLTGQLPRRSAPLTDALVTLSFVLLGFLLMRAKRPVWIYGSLLLAVICYHFFHAFLFSTYRVWVAHAMPMLGLITTFSFFQFFRYKILHKEAEVKTLSINFINELPKLLTLEYKSFDSYLKSVWPQIEKNNKICLVHAKCSLDQVRQLLPVVADKGYTAGDESVLIFEQDGGQFLYLALIPLHREHHNGVQEFTVLGWKHRFEKSHLEAIIALVLSCNWYFDMIKQVLARKNMLLDTIHAIAAAIDAKDPVTGGHSHRVSEITREITEYLELDPQVQEDIFLGALIHDIGKIGIPDFILSKPDKLTDEEYKIIKNHPDIGTRIMKSVQLPELTVQGIEQHHERIDGTGYPAQLTGKDISLAGKIIAVADVFDALTNERPYRKEMTLDEVCSFMIEGKGAYFDETVLNALISIKKKLELEKQRHVSDSAFVE